MTMTGLQLCTIGDLIPGEECQRLAQWTWQPESDNHPLYLCNYHAEPLTANSIPLPPARACQREECACTDAAACQQHVCCAIWSGRAANG